MTSSVSPPTDCNIVRYGQWLIATVPDVGDFGQRRVSECKGIVGKVEEVHAVTTQFLERMRGRYPKWFESAGYRRHYEDLKEKKGGSDQEYAKALYDLLITIDYDRD